jgi:(p)ppGpp synthase/HD superfamily hydrolase
MLATGFDLTDVGVDNSVGAMSFRSIPQHPTLRASNRTGHTMTDKHVELARTIAEAAHAGQVDKLGEAYINHPERVASAFDPDADAVAHCSAWLHDVVEDSPTSLDDLLAAGIPPEVVEVIALLTRTDDIDADAYYRAIREHPIALRVKLSDLADNQAPWRVARLDPELRDRLVAKYSHARQILEETR